VLNISNSAGIISGVSISKGETMKTIEMLKPKIIGGKHYKVGDVVEVTEDDERLLIVTQAAKSYIPKPKRRSKKDV
jgi:hypothetical protein